MNRRKLLKGLLALGGVGGIAGLYAYARWTMQTAIFTVAYYSCKKSFAKPAQIIIYTLLNKFNKKT
ncbi:MAG: hypothetical protein RI894_1663 [Bacteroidota bacterium]|jgi:hypothetical protein